MKSVLFVCTGNTCRSAMAEYLFNFHAKKRGIDACASSAGVMAAGMPMSHYSQEELLKRGISASAHRSTRVTQAAAEHATMVICMSPTHLSAIHKIAPKANAQLITQLANMGQSGVPDPYGGAAFDYARTAEMIESCVRKILDGFKTNAD